MHYFSMNKKYVLIFTRIEVAVCGSEPQDSDCVRAAILTLHYCIGGWLQGDSNPRDYVMM